MNPVNYDDFCNLWRLYDVGDDPDAYGCEVDCCFMIFRRGGNYYYSAHCGFSGDLNDTEVPLTIEENAKGEYENGEPLRGGLKVRYGPDKKSSVTFTLNKMGDRAFLISLSRPVVEALTAQSHGGAHGVPD